MTSEMDKTNWLTMNKFLHLRWEIKEYLFSLPRMAGWIEPVISPGIIPLRNPTNSMEMKNPAARLTYR
jgi:hypothetical protein